MNKSKGLKKNTLSSHQHPITLDHLVAGVTLFFSTIYIAPLLVSLFGNIVPNSKGIFLGTILALTLATFLNALWARVGFVLAPAVGIAVFLVSYIQSTSIPWENAFIASSIAGLLVFFFSLLKVRIEILNSIPDQIRLSIKSAVGALLVEAAYKTITAAQKITNDLIPVGLFLMGLFLIFLVLGVEGRLEEIKGLKLRVKEVIELLSKAIFVIVIVLVFFLLPEGLKTFPNNLVSGDTLWLWEQGDLNSLFVASQIMAIVPIVIVISFILISDIPGTPYELLEGTTEDPVKGKIVKRSFIIDGFASFLGPLIGTTPLLFYAENHVLTIFNNFHRNIGFVVAGMGLLTIFVTLAPGAEKFAIWLFNIPPLTFAPIIAAIGIIMIAHSMCSPFERDKNTRDPNREFSFKFYLPSAIALTTTPLFGLEVSLPLSLGVYWLFTRKDERKLTERQSSLLGFISIFGGLAGVISLVMKLNS